MIFADTSFLFAGMMPDDRHHQEAMKLRAQLGTRDIATSNHVIGETWTLVRRRQSHSMAVRFLDLIEATSNLSVEWIDRTIEADAFDWLRHRDEREYSFVDATSFTLMRKLGITEALAFDGDFAAAGFVELRP